MEKTMAMNRSAVHLTLLSEIILSLPSGPFQKVLSPKFCMQFFSLNFGYIGSSF